MADEQDVKPSEPSTEETTEEDLEAELTEAAKEEESADVKEDSQPSDESKEEEQPEEAPEDLKARLAKLEEQNQNLNKALQEKRRVERQLQAPLVAASTTPEPGVKIDPGAYVQALVAQAEEEAKQDLFKEFPELSQENDPDNIAYNAFAENFALAAKVKRITPVTKEQFLEVGRQVMAYKTGKTKDETKAKAEGKAEAHREALKADAANIGGTSASKPEVQIDATEADRRAAKAVGMDIKKFMKSKDVYDDGIPI